MREADLSEGTDAPMAWNEPDSGDLGSQESGETRQSCSSWVTKLDRVCFP